MFTFIESTVFQRALPDLLDDEEYAGLQEYMMLHPEAGKVIPGSGGIRKLRWRRAGRGKRGGLRVIHFVRYHPNEFWMLTLYAKAAQDNIPAKILRELKESIGHE